MATTVKSMDELKRVIEKRLSVAIQETQDMIYDKINKHIIAYYREKVFPIYGYKGRIVGFSDQPNEYSRIYEFGHNFIKSDLVIKNGQIFCTVGFDEDYLDWTYPSNPDQKHNTPATGRQVVEWANEGFHGGTVKGSLNFWDDAIEELGGREGILNIVKTNLKKAGIPVL